MSAPVEVDQTKGQCFVYSFKDGLLSSVAHDLKHVVTRWSLTIDKDQRRITGTFDPTSLRVVGVMRQGHEDRNLPSDRDRRTIEGHILDDVLEPRRYPTITIDAIYTDQYIIEGTLDLHGVKRPLRATATRVAETFVVRVSLNQTEHRIKPFSAMLGTLKIKPVVEIELTIPQ